MLPSPCSILLQRWGDLSRREGSSTATKGSFRWGPIFQVNFPLRFQSPRGKCCLSFKRHKSISVLEEKYEKSNFTRIYWKRIYFSVLRLRSSHCCGCTLDSNIPMVICVSLAIEIKYLSFKLWMVLVPVHDKKAQHGGRPDLRCCGSSKSWYASGPDCLQCVMQGICHPACFSLARHEPAHFKKHSPAPSVSGVWPFSIQKETEYLQAKPVSPNRTSMFSLTPAELASIAVSTWQEGDSCEGAPVRSCKKRSTHKIPALCTRTGFIVLQYPGTALHVLKRHLLVFYLGIVRICTNIPHFVLSPK